MEELIKYFESLEDRIATLEAELASLEAEMDELKNCQTSEPQVIEKVVEKVVEKPVEVIKEVIKEVPVEVIKEVIVEKPVVVEPEPEVSPDETGETPDGKGEIEEPVVEPAPVAEPAPQPVQEEVASPKAAVYGKAVDDIRQAISLGDRFLYQRELFGQNAELMQRTLNELNQLGSFDDAMNYIGKHFEWDTESSTYQQFLVTLHRRFG